MPAHDPEHLKRVVSDLQKLDTRMRFNKLELYKPYAKQQEFHDMGSVCSERLLIAGNQVGKTLCGAAECAMHLTGRYPDWWLGRRWDRQVEAWAGSDTSTTTRDVVQKHLFGRPGIMEEQGSGMLPKDAVLWDKITTARGIGSFYDTIPIRHISGGLSTLTLKTYEQGWEKWQGATVDFIWMDEEAKEPELYPEAVTRITAKRGMIYTTFTPLKGVTKLVQWFKEKKSPNRGYVEMTVFDAKHFTAEDIEDLKRKYPPHLLKAKLYGVPLLGEGAIFLKDEEELKEDLPDPLPRHWFYIWGMDFGGVSLDSHPWAAVLLGWDKDADVVYICHVIRESGLRPVDEARLILSKMEDAPVAWPQDGTAREKTSGETLAALYKKEKLRMLGEHATHPDGGLSTEAGVAEMDNAMKGGKFKVARHLTKFFEEYRNYHREKGLIVKTNDDILSATRIAWMMRRKARQVDSLDPWKRANASGGRKILQAQTDFNPYTGA